MKPVRKHLFTLLMLAMLVAVASCMGSPSGRTGGGTSSDNISVDGEGGGSGNGATSEDGSFGGENNITLTDPKTDVRHLIDPFDGSFKTKLTIPKNFTGDLYVSGINVAALKDKIVHVRFNFGRDLEAVDLPATIGRAAGLTPQTEIDVLILDASDQPFKHLRLLYDLYDYSGDTTEPVSDARDSSLYCRGLRLEHDPTFSGSTTNTKCDIAGERCLYSYAKIVDSGLYDGALALSVSEPQIDLSGSGYLADTSDNNLKKCLPDTNSSSQLINVLGGSTVASFVTSLPLGVPETIAVDGTNYTYMGPYRPVNEGQWEIKGPALFNTVVGSKYGLFDNSFDLTYSGATGGYHSLLFPRAGKMNLTAGVEHFSNADALYQARSVTALVSSGETDYMDGCNLRVSKYDPTLNEGISSCNVTATIQIITKDVYTGEVSVISSSNEVKLQLIRSSKTDYQGREVLYTSLNACSNSQACAANECCYNERCWSKELVTQCLEDVSNVGSLGTGQACSSDYECASFCCNESTGKCAVHDTTVDPPVYCSKSPGQMCVARDWCAKQNVPECYIVKTGIDSGGNVTCTLRCYNVPTFGKCTEGICRPPTIPNPPTFDSTNPNCTNAIDPPTNL